MKMISLTDSDTRSLVFLHPANVVAVREHGRQTMVHTAGGGTGGDGLMFTVLEPLPEVIEKINACLRA
ncbi:hypothetical protein ACIKTA_08995 [Hansschlegelia beijingensis]|uniref:hypothetical protein n=1 Tax=Hansschlegelia beijingensis TaxID=1133344 RepID=UPI00381DAA4B